MFNSAMLLNTLCMFQNSLESPNNVNFIFIDRQKTLKIKSNYERK